MAPRGHEAVRQRCPYCGRKIACSFDPDGKHVWLRRHNDPNTGERCKGRHVRRHDDGHREVDVLGQPLYEGDEIEFMPKSKGPAIPGTIDNPFAKDGKIGVLLEGDPFPVRVEPRQVKKRGKNEMPITKSEARDLKRSAKALGIDGWEQMRLKELKAAVRRAEKGKAGKKKAKPEKVSREEAAAYSEERAAKKSGKAKPKSSKKAKTKAAAEAPARKTKKSTKAKVKADDHPQVSSRMALTGAVNPFRPGSNVFLMAEELMKGGKRIDMIKRLQKNGRLVPFSKSEEDIDPIKEWDKRLLLTAGDMEKKYGFRQVRDGRGVTGTIRLVPKGAKPKSSAKASSKAKPKASSTKTKSTPKKGAPAKTKKSTKKKSKR